MGAPSWGFIPTFLLHSTKFTASLYVLSAVTLFVVVFDQYGIPFTTNLTNWAFAYPSIRVPITRDFALPHAY